MGNDTLTRKLSSIYNGIERLVVELDAASIVSSSLHVTPDQSVGLPPTSTCFGSGVTNPVFERATQVVPTLSYLENSAARDLAS